MSHRPHHGDPTAEDVMDVLNERGWCQGTLENHEGNVCLLGAIGVAAYGDIAGADVTPLYHKVVKRLSNSPGQPEHDPLAATFVGGKYSIPAFNDRDTTTLEDVMMLLKEVANDDQ